MYTLRLQSFRKGEVIFTEGSRGADAYVIHEGEVEILKSGPQRQPVSLRVMTAGEMFGEMGLVTSNPRAATAVASTITSPAPPTAREPRWTRCQSVGRPSTDEY